MKKTLLRLRWYVSNNPLALHLMSTLFKLNLFLIQSGSSSCRELQRLLASLFCDTRCDAPRHLMQHGKVNARGHWRIRPKMSQRFPFLTLPKVPCALRKFVPKLSLPVYEGVIPGSSFKGISYRRGYDVTNTLHSIIVT